MSSGEAAADVQAAALLVVVRRTGNTHSCCLTHDCTAELTNVPSCTGRRHESSSQTWSFMTRTASQCPCLCTPAKEESANIATLDLFHSHGSKTDTQNKRSTIGQWRNRSAAGSIKFLFSPVDFVLFFDGWRSLRSLCGRSGARNCCARRSCSRDWKAKRLFSQ